MAAKRSQTRKPKRSKTTRTAVAQAGDGPREEDQDYLHVKQGRESFDAAGWEASIAQRQRMATIQDGTLDPGPGVLGSRRRAGVFVGDDGVKATVRAVKPGAPELGLVRTVDLVSSDDFTPGALVLPIGPKDVESLDARSLTLFRLNEDGKGYKVLEACGLNVEGGYAWARVTSPGRYALFGLPMLKVLADFSLKKLKDLLMPGPLLSPLLLILLRSFLLTATWHSVGPRSISCCIWDMAVDPSDGNRVYAAASDGGLWRLESVANYPQQTWIPLTDHQPSLRIRAVAVSPVDPHLVYYADDAGRLFRSGDRGGSWEQVGSAPLGGDVRRIIAHPAERNRVYVASSTGFWASATGGTTWEQNPGHNSLLDGDMGDAEIDPDDPSTIYVGQRAVGVLKTGDGGANWRTVLPWSTAQTPITTMIKVAVGGQGTASKRTVAAKLDQEVFVSRTAGEQPAGGGQAWKSEGKHGGSQQGGWNSVVAIDPNDDNVIFAGAERLFRRDSSGAWSLVVDFYMPHEDQHRIAFHPTQPKVVYLANDGGVFRSTNGGVTWQTNGDDVAAGRDLSIGLITAQFYTAATSGEHALGNTYHQGMLGAVNLESGAWIGVEGHSWESMNVYGDPRRPDRHYVLHPAGIFRRDFPNPPSGPALLQISNFAVRAVAACPAIGSKTLIAAAADGRMMRALNGEADSPAWKQMNGFSPNAAAVSIAFAPSKPQRAYALTELGRVYVCDDVASTDWREVKELPRHYARAITVDPDDHQRVFAITAERVYRSTTAGLLWDEIQGTGANTVPAGSTLVSIVARPGGLHLGAASGVYVSPDAGQNWFPDVAGLPNAEVKEMLWDDGYLYAVTHGRGIWCSNRHRPFLFWPKLPPLGHKLDIGWLIQLWFAIHGGDPGPPGIGGLLGKRILTLAETRPPSGG